MVYRIPSCQGYLFRVDEDRLWGDDLCEVSVKVSVRLMMRRSAQVGDV